MYPEKNKFFKHIDFIILDILCMEVSFIIAYFIRHRNFSLFNQSTYRSILIILLIANIFSCYFLDSMKDVLKRPKQLDFYSTVKQVLVTTIILISYIFLTKISDDISRNTIVLFPFIYLVLSFITRLIFKSILVKSFKQKASRNMIIVASKTNAARLINDIQDSVNDIFIKGVIDIEKDSADGSDNVLSIPIVAGLNDATRYLQTEYVDEVLVSGEGSSITDLIQKISLMGIVLHIELPEKYDFITANNKLFVDNIYDINVITSTVNTINPVQLIIKRIVDIVFGIFGTIATIIFAIIIGPIIKLKSKGPIFFMQDRVGKNGKIFKMIKFRSMVVDADELKEKYKAQNENKDGLMFKMTNDPRVIPGIGEFIRKTSIDEFPQFINVLKGEMSVVGTRPPTIDEWEKYDLHHRARLAIKPGITGLWQVSGRSDIKDFEDVVKLDTKYIKTFSLWQDFSIILKTIKVVLNKEGAR